MSAKEERLNLAFTDPEPCLHPDDLENFVAKVDRVVSRNGKFIAVEPRIRSQDGGWKWFRVRGVPVRDPDGNLIRVVGSLIDISKRRTAGGGAELDQSPSR